MYKIHVCFIDKNIPNNRFECIHFEEKETFIVFTISNNIRDHINKNTILCFDAEYYEPNKDSPSS